MGLAACGATTNDKPTALICETLCALCEKIARPFSQRTIQKRREAQNPAPLKIQRNQKICSISDQAPGRSVMVFVIEFCAPGTR
jgi:hypothetical protein